MKTCSTCKRSKPAAEFHRCRTNHDGLNKRCKECAREFGRRHRAKHRQKVAKSKSEYASANAGKIREYQRRWRAENSEHRRQYSSNYQHKNRAKLNAQARSRANYKDYYERNGRKCHYKKRYGITVAEYNRLLELQKGQCAICKTDHPGKGKRHFHIDHDHLTGAVRGLLCATCNLGLGSFRDDSALLRDAMIYIMDARSKSNPADYEG